MFRRLIESVPGAGRWLARSGRLRPVRALALAAAGVAIAVQAGGLASRPDATAPTVGTPGGFAPSPVILGTRG